VGCNGSVANSEARAKKGLREQKECDCQMRIEVLGSNGISPQARTYAEYRVFAALTRVTDLENIRSARVQLRQVMEEGDCESIACTVTIALKGSDSLRIRTTGPHPYAAINRAVDRIRRVAAPGMVDRASS
jgi:ribosome-associated translation inhibitor RaiA